MYNISSIIINHRDVSINDIRQGAAIAETAFETSTFNFIKDWLSGVDQFTLNTSGSTGEAKPIILTRLQMQHSATLTVKALALTSGNRALVCLPTQYVAGKMMLVRAMETGMKIVAMEPSSNPLAQTIFGADFTAVVPLQLEQILASQNEYAAQVDAMKAILVGGAPVSDSLIEATQRTNAPVYATYGMTETISHIALRRLNGKDAAAFFSTLPGIKIQRDGRGCLVIHAPYLSESVTTNDVVDIVDEHSFQWIGRWDNVINTGGIKVMPEKIELIIGKIFSHFGINQNFFVHGVPDQSLGSKIILAVEGEKISRENELIKRLHQTLPKYEIPKEIIFISQFVYTETGKINRKKTLKTSSIQ